MNRNLRTHHFGRVSTELRSLSDHQLAALVARSDRVYEGVGGKASLLEIEDRLALETGVPMVDASEAWLRMPAEDVEWLWGAHPNAAVYSEIARDVAAAVREITGKESN